MCLKDYLRPKDQTLQRGYFGLEVLQLGQLLSFLAALVMILSTFFVIANLLSLFKVYQVTFDTQKQNYLSHRQGAYFDVWFPQDWLLAWRFTFCSFVFVFMSQDLVGALWTSCRKVCKSYLVVSDHQHLFYREGTFAPYRNNSNSCFIHRTDKTASLSSIQRHDCGNWRTTLLEFPYASAPQVKRSDHYC